MVESHTAKKSHKKSRRSKSAKTQDIIDLEIATDLAAAYIKSWVHEQAKNSLLSSKKPLILTSGSGYQVGRFAVKREDNNWKVSNRARDTVGVFNWKSSAVAFCVLEHLQRFTEANKVRMLDNIMGKFEMDMIYYKKSIETSMRKKDTTKAEFIWNRYLQAQAQFEVSRRNLEKSLKSTKYLKVWDTKS